MRVYRLPYPLFTYSISVMNNVLVKYGAASKYGAEIPMTTLGITMKVNQIITGIVIGISVARSPSSDTIMGPERHSEPRKLSLAIICSTLVMGVGTCVSAVP